jgi:uncharacterized membrane protein
MSTRVSIAGHPLHAMLVTIPIGLWVFSLISDIAFMSTGDARWATTAYFTLGGGIVGALLAAVPGLLDFLGLHEPRERRVGTMHLALNLAIVAIQAVNFWLRAASDVASSLPILPEERLEERVRTRVPDAPRDLVAGASARNDDDLAHSLARLKRAKRFGAALERQPAGNEWADHSLGIEIEKRLDRLSAGCRIFLHYRAPGCGNNLGVFEEHQIEPDAGNAGSKADYDQAPAWRDRSQRCFRVFPANRIEHYVDATFQRRFERRDQRAARRRVEWPGRIDEH